MTLVVENVPVLSIHYPNQQNISFPDCDELKVEGGMFNESLEFKYYYKQS